MKLTTVLFDLDGTLLPMDLDYYTKEYFKLLSSKMTAYGYEPKQLVDAVLAGTAAMVKNNGEQTNEAVFWQKFSDIYGQEALSHKCIFDTFYENEFQKTKELCGYNPMAADTVHLIKKIGLRTVLATNPIFPAAATKSRIRWAGLQPEDFELYTTYENSCFCKPNTDYYRDILKKMNISAEECLMVGNDVTEDMVAKTLGMKVFLITDCLINKSGKSIDEYPNGSFEQLTDFIKNSI